MTKKEENLFKIYNRKYLGSKTKLLEKIFEIVEKETKGKYDSVIDIFGGTGVVSDFFANKGKKVIINDFLESNYLIYNAFFSTEKVSSNKLIKLANEFNEKIYEGSNYFSIFGDKYFSVNDVLKIGGIREEIEILKKSNKINKRERLILIASLIYSSDRIANSMGHYEIYINRKVNDKFVFKLIDWENNGNVEKIFNKDSNELIKEIQGDVLYMDPPYNSRQYSTLYHLLDNLANWDNPTVVGKGLKPKYPQKSKYSLKEAREAMLDIVLNADVKYIFVSYNNTQDASNSRTAAKITEEEMMTILSLRGKVKKIEFEYKPYNTGNSSLKDYKEILYVCEVKKPTLKLMNVKYPLNYMGGKFKLLDKIKEEIKNYPSNSNFIDVFTGGANVGANVDFENIFCFDSNERQIELLNIIKNEETFTLIEKIDNIIDKYNLSKTHINGYKFYDSVSSTGLKSFNNENYLRLREDYNKKIDPYLFIVLIIFSFNNSMNFNLKGEFNIPCGKRDFNSKMRQNFILFSKKIKSKNINFIHSDFIYIEEFIKNNIKGKKLFYLDPPYISGFAHYNKQWGEEQEVDLYDFLDKISVKNHFIFSNSLQIGNNKNEKLADYIKIRKHRLVLINHNYDNSWFHKKEIGNKEILLTNIIKN